MRLTLRTLLAYEHGLLEQEQADLIAQKIEQSPFVLQLLRHLKDRATRAEIVPLSIDARGTASLDKVVRYLDFALPAEEVVKLENECFASDRLLAEVAACHDILAQWLSTPTPLEPALRERLYAVIPGQRELAEHSAPDEIAIELPSLTYCTNPPQKTAVQRKPQPEMPPKKRSLAGMALQLLALSACVMGLVTFVVFNRDQVEQMIAQHWEQKSNQAEDTGTDGDTLAVSEQPASPLNEPLPANDLTPKRFVAQAVPLNSVADRSPAPIEPETLTEVTTTSFEHPIQSAKPLMAVPAGVYVIETADAVLAQEDSLEIWSWRKPGPYEKGRLIVADLGACQFRSGGIDMRLGGLSEIALEEDSQLRLRYGQLEVKLSPGSTFRLQAADQAISLAAGSSLVHLKMKTAAVTDAGIDFASDVTNQEIQVESLAGPCEITLSSCRGPFQLNRGEKIAAHMKFGVRSDPSIHFALDAKIPAQQHPLLAAQREGVEPVEQLQRVMQASSPQTERYAAIVLAQMGEMGTLPEAWSRWAGQAEFDAHGESFRRLIAQDEQLAARLRATLDVKSPQYGSLIYRLICGFSSEQLNEATRSQLTALLRHPEPAVRAWTQYQLNRSEGGPAAQHSQLRPSES